LGERNGAGGEDVRDPQKKKQKIDEGGQKRKGKTYSPRGEKKTIRSWRPQSYENEPRCQNREELKKGAGNSRHKQTHQLLLPLTGGEGIEVSGGVRNPIDEGGGGRDPKRRERQRLEAVTTTFLLKGKGRVDSLQRDATRV